MEEKNPETIIFKLSDYYSFQHIIIIRGKHH